MSHGGFGIFFTRPISGGLMATAILFVLYNIWSAQRKKRTVQAV
jgi:TctA family transporter